jgi:hypothetical protein
VGVVRTLGPMGRLAISVTAAALLCGTALLASACGSSNSASAALTATAGRTPQTASSGAAPHLALLTAKNCRVIVSLPLTFSNAVTGIGSDVDQAVPLLKKLAAQAPLSVRADFEVLAVASVKIVTTLKGVDLAAMNAQAIAKLRALSNEIDTARITSISSTVSDWAQANC